jgi:hypothetical protein
MKNQRDIINDVKPIRFSIPPAGYFHQLADIATEQEHQLTRKRNYRKVVFAVATLAACWLLVFWLFPSSKNGQNIAALAKTESASSTTFQFSKPLKNHTNKSPIISKKAKGVKSLPQKAYGTNTAGELDLSSLSQEEILAYLDEEEVDAMELEEFLFGNY